MCKTFYLDRFLKNNDIKFNYNLIVNLYCELKKEFKGEIKFFQYFKKMLTGSDIDNISERINKLLKNPTTAISLNKLQLLYGKTAGIEKWDKYRKSIAMSLENQIKKYGEIEGTERWNKYCERQAYTNTLPYFIEKYGIKEGKEKYFKVNKAKSHTLESYVDKWGIESGEEKFKEYREKCNSPAIYSLISQELFDNITKNININHNIYYATKNKEFGKYNKELKKYYMYDFVIPELKICIEFNGNVFHANPKMFSENEYPNPFVKEITSKEIWEFDRIKNDFIKNLGFDVIIVWEDEYKNNKQEVIDNIVSYIEDKNDNYR